MFSAKNGLNLLIGKSISRSTPVQVTDRTAADFIADGEVVVLKSDGTAITAGETITDSEWIQLVQRSGATAATADLIYSPRIFGQYVTSFTGKDGVAAVEQVTHIGFTGVTTVGSIVTTAEQRLLHITYDMDEQSWSEQQDRRVYQFVGTTPTQDEIAESIARQINADGGSKVSAIILTDNAAGDSAVITGTTTTFNVSNGSPRMFANNGTTTNVAVGDYVRVGAEDTITVGVYKVKAVTTTTNSNDTIEFTMPFQGVSNSALAIASTGRITAAVVISAADNWGVQLTGLPLTFSKGFFKYLKTSFTVGLPTAGWGTTTLTYTTVTNRGTGVYEQIAELEWFALGEDGALNRTIVPLPTGHSDATVGALYDTIAVHYFDASDQYAVSGTKPSPRLLYVAVVDGGAQGTSLINELNPWMASTPRNFAAIAL